LKSNRKKHILQKGADNFKPQKVFAENFLKKKNHALVGFSGLELL